MLGGKEFRLRQGFGLRPLTGGAVFTAYEAPRLAPAIEKDICQADVLFHTF